MVGGRADFRDCTDLGGSARKAQRSPSIPEARQIFHICSKVASPRAQQPREGLHNSRVRDARNKKCPFVLIICIFAG